MTNDTRCHDEVHGNFFSDVYLLSVSCNSFESIGRDI